MAYRISSPSRGGYTIPSSPVGSYEAVAAKYANDFRNALRQQEQNELNSKILAWQRGELSWEELKKYLDERIKGAEDNSTEKVNLTEILTRLEAQNKELFEYQQKEIAARIRTEMTENLAEGGLTDQEQLNIVKAMKEAVDKESETYASLVQEEAQLKTRLAQSAAAAGEAAAKESAQERYRLTRAEILQDINSTELAYQFGQISGFERDARNLANAEALGQIMSEAADAGVPISQSEIEMATNFLNTNQQMLDFRRQGLVADAVDSKGQITTVATNEQNFGQEFVIDSQGRLKLSGVADVGGVWQDPVTGFYGIAGERAATYESRSEAIKEAQEKGVLSLDVVIPSPEGGTKVTTLQKDPETGVFYNPQNPSETYVSLPQTKEQLEAYRFENLPSDWVSVPEVKDWMKETVGEFPGAGEIDLRYEVEEPTELDKTSRSFSDIFKREFGDFTSDLGEKVKGFWENLREKEKQVREKGYQLGPLSVTPAFGMSDIKIGSFDVPEFNVPTFQKMASKLGFGGEPTSTTPQPVGISQSSQGPTGFLGRVKQFGQNLLGKIGGFLGGQ